MAQIPPALIGTTGPILDAHYTHAELNSLFMQAGFPGDPPARLIQLADAFAWLTVQRWGLRKGDMSKLVDETTNGVNLFPNRYKYWPNT